MGRAQVGAVRGRGGGSGAGMLRTPLGSLPVQGRSTAGAQLLGERVKGIF